MGKTYVQGEVLNATDLNASFLELKTLPINPQTSTYTLVVDDLGKVISATGPVDIPANVFASGGTVSIFNNSTAVININQAAGLTLYNASTSVAGSFTLNSRGICSVIFVNTTTAVLTGVGVSVTASGTLQGPIGYTGSQGTATSSSALTVTAGSTNATQYTPITSIGGSTLFVDQQQTTSVSTAATVILVSPRYATLALVHGSDGTNRFSDLVLMSVGTGTVNVISSLTASGSPAARTYSQTSSTFRLAMASGTYTVRVASIGINS